MYLFIHLILTLYIFFLYFFPSVLHIHTTAQQPLGSLQSPSCNNLYIHVESHSNASHRRTSATTWNTLATSLQHPDTLPFQLSFDLSLIFQLSCFQLFPSAVYFPSGPACLSVTSQRLNEGDLRDGTLLWVPLDLRQHVSMLGDQGRHRWLFFFFFSTFSLLSFRSFFSLLEPRLLWFHCVGRCLWRILYSSQLVSMSKTIPEGI